MSLGDWEESAEDPLADWQESDEDPLGDWAEAAEDPLTVEPTTVELATAPRAPALTLGRMEDLLEGPLASPASAPQMGRLDELGAQAVPAAPPPGHSGLQLSKPDPAPPETGWGDAWSQPIAAPLEEKPAQGPNGEAPTPGGSMLSLAFEKTPAPVAAPQPAAPIEPPRATVAPVGSWGVEGAEVDPGAVAGPTSGPFVHQEAFRTRQRQQRMIRLLWVVLVLLVAGGGLVLWQQRTRIEAQRDTLLEVFTDLDPVVEPADPPPPPPPPPPLPKPTQPFQTQTVRVQVRPAGVRFVQVPDGTVLCEASEECEVPINVDTRLELKGHEPKVLLGDDLYDRRGGRWRIVMVPEGTKRP